MDGTNTEFESIAADDFLRRYFRSRGYREAPDSAKATLLSDLLRVALDELDQLEGTGIVGVRVCEAIELLETSCAPIDQ